MSKRKLQESNLEAEKDSSDESEIEWEEVPILPTEEQASTTNEDIEIVVKKRKGITKRQRVIQQLMHQVHLLCLLCAATFINQWCNNLETKALVFSMLPNVKLTKLTEIFKRFRSSFEIDMNADEFVVDRITNSLPPNKYCAAFVAILRGLGIESRLIALLNPIPLSLAKSKPVKSIELLCEVFDKKKSQWVKIDIINGLIDTNKKYKARYALAFEQDMTVKDLSVIYLDTNTRRSRLANEWWDMTLWLYSKSHKSQRDILEDEKLESSKADEHMPTRLNDFINHPIFALERHLHQDELMYPNSKADAVGTIKNELVFPRENVKKLYSAEGWKRLGRKVLENQVCVKRIKQRRNNQEKDKDLFGEWQTEPLKRPSMIDGKIVTNEHGNIELFHENMLPIGAVHVQDQTAHIVAKALGINFSRAVVSFSFKRGQATPVYDGIVTSQENHDLLLEAIHNYKAEMNEKEAIKREQRVISRWKSIYLKLKLRDRLFRDYL